MESESEYSKKAQKKAAAKAEKVRRRQEAAAAAARVEEVDVLASNYGEIPWDDLQSTVVTGRSWTAIASLSDDMIGHSVLIRGHAQSIRGMGKMAFVVVREKGFSVQCVVAADPKVVSKGMIEFVKSLSRESIIDVEGIVSFPTVAIKAASQEVEIHVRKLMCVNKAVRTLPFLIEDACRSELEIANALEAGGHLVRVNQDTRLKFRTLDLRTPANQAIFCLQDAVENKLAHFLRCEGFVATHTPKLIAGSTEGGSAVFKLDYKGQPACLAQSPQLHKQMLMCSDFGRVFEIGSFFRAEDSFTHRHLCEFTGLHVEMEIRETYSEVMDVVDRLFVSIFDDLNNECQKELDSIGKQYPFKPLKYLRKTLRLTFEQGVQMLKDAGTEVSPLSDLNTESERKLGQLVLETYGTEFYILHRFPLDARPFFTMPCRDNPAYSNSFDAFLRGEEILSGAQRIHDPARLEERAISCGINVQTTSISTYIDSLRYGAPPHGGFGVGLERLMMLYCDLNNIRKTSLFPRDPHRLTP